jgi:lipopolysaccharide transport system permease protein
VVSVAIYTVQFGVLLNVSSGEVPYAIFALTGLLPWTYFSQALNRSSTSVVTSAQVSQVPVRVILRIGRDD